MVEAVADLTEIMPEHLGGQAAVAQEREIQQQQVIPHLQHHHRAIPAGLIMVVEVERGGMAGVVKALLAEGLDHYLLLLVLLLIMLLVVLEELQTQALIQLAGKERLLLALIT
jgi:hypothetical protein